MYEAHPDVTRLRQGDVIKGVYFPNYALASLRLLHALESSGAVFKQQALLNADETLAVVLSQCCEFNEGKRQAFSLAALVHWRERILLAQSWGFALAKLVPFSKSPLRGPDLGDADRILPRLKQANDVEAKEFQNTYLYDPLGEHLTEHYVCDFSRIVSVSMKDKGQVLKGKILQLDQAHRRQFQLKLGIFYSRNAE